LFETGCACERGEGIAGISSGDKLRLAEVVLCCDVLEFVFRGAVEDTDGNGEDGVAFAAITQGVVNDFVFGGGLFLACVAHVTETFFFAAHVDLGETFVEEDFGRVELEFEA